MNCAILSGAKIIRDRPLLAQLSRSACVRNLAHRFRSFMAIDRNVSAHRGSSK
jgi:hypothetical protein